MALNEAIEATISMEKQDRLGRDIGVDIVKTVAILSVVGVHFFLNTRFYRVDLDNTNLFIQTIIQQICLICIQLYL